MLAPRLRRWIESDFRLNTLVDGDAEDLADRCCTEVRDVEVAVRAECHTGGNGESGGYIFDNACAVKAYNLPDTKWWGRKTGGIVESLDGRQTTGC